jgi:hypothetical protein
LETAGGTTRIIIGEAAAASWPVWLACILAPAALGVIAYRSGAASAYGALAAAVFGAAALLGGERLMRMSRRSSEDSAVCLDAERIWIEGRASYSQWIDDARAVFADAAAPDAPAESLPLESMPVSVVEQVRVEQREGREAGAAPHALLLIEANAGRLELIGALPDRKRLEWVRDYLRYRLAGED